MRAPLLIVGQGLAGTLLGHACERAGLRFEIADAGHAGAASRVGAGIINPVTGQRIVKSRGIDTLRLPALAMYRELETGLGVPLVREMRVRRLFRDDAERRIFADKTARDELTPYVNAGSADADGFWIEGALRIDTAALIEAARSRWLQAGILREERVELPVVLCEYDRVIACTGAGEPAAWGGTDCRLASGHILRLAVEGLAPEVILNRGHWVLPTTAGQALVGATYVRGGRGEASAARAELEGSAEAMLGAGRFAVMSQEEGLRVTTPDRMPIAGYDPTQDRLGVFNGLGSKGALLAPWLARQWVERLTSGRVFAAEVDVARLAR
jgi:glycine oxidase